MKRTAPCILALWSITLFAANAEKSPATDESPASSARLTNDYNLNDPFSPDELRSLAEKKLLKPNEKRRLMLLILHAGIRKDHSFQDLLKKPELRKAMNVDLALSGYDYMLNKSETALDHILAQLATEDIGADVDTIVVLSTLDEWDRSIRAYRKHFVRTDGAGGLCAAGFIEVRAHLYPKKYQEMRALIEAPMEWTAPLLPRKQ